MHIEQKEVFCLDSQQYRVRPMALEDVPTALEIVDTYLGAGMYTEATLAEFIYRPCDFFYIIEDDQGIAGLFCIKTLLAHQLNQTYGYTKDFWKPFCQAEDKVAIYRGFVVLERARGHNLASTISVPYVNKMFEEEGIKALFAAAWIKGDWIPAKNVLVANGMTAGPIMPRAWYGCKSMYCPYCKQKPCICDAQLYYRLK
ncbi:MAG: hypothetical protein R3Y62_00310 [Eubacteriales bacterium]